MDLIKCPWCEMTISDENERCPLCKRPLNAKPSEIAFFHAAQRKDNDYRAARQEEREAQQQAAEPAQRHESETRAYSGPTEYCRFCGEKIPERSNFCPECDSRLRSSRWWMWIVVAALIAFAYYLGGR